MSALFYILISPFLLLISIPLTIFATITTILSFSTLFVRVLMVYAELAAALIQDHFASSSNPPSRMTSPSLKSISEGKVGRRRSRRASAASGSSNGSATPKAPRTSGLGVYSGEGAARDFEGVGGWRIPGPDGEDALWTSMNSRLELPAMVGGRQRHHHRSSTSGSLHNYDYYSKSSVASQALSPQQQSTSPEHYFTGRVPSKSTTSKSTTALDAANIGKTLSRPRPSSSSSGSSQGSNRTLHLTLSNS